MEDQQPASTAASSSATPARKSSLSAECESCVSYLARALDRVGSKQHSLLRAMGVVTQHTSEEEEKIYQRSKDGRGILVQLKSDPSIIDPVSNKSNANHLNNAVKADCNSETVRRHTKSNIKEQEQIIDNANGTTSATTTLRNRLTKAASQLVEGIRHSADEIINNDSVLSTSPNEEKPTLTTIAIECEQCGSETRAEAGARAYVKGPDPLSIVLCSNRLSSQREVDEVLTHELIHIYDIKKKKMDLTDCKQLAYSEIRAAREAECSNSLTLNMQKICSKDKATVATKNMFPDEGRGCVCSVFDEALNDRMPFAPIQKQQARKNPHRASDR